MKSLIFLALVLSAVAYLGYSQSSRIRQWADIHSDGKAADIVSQATELKDDVAGKLHRVFQDWQASDARIAALEEKVSNLHDELARVKEMLRAGYGPVARTAKPAVGDPDRVGQRGAPKTASIAAVNSGDLLVLIEKMELKAAGL